MHGNQDFRSISPCRSFSRRPRWTSWNRNFAASAGRSNCRHSIPDLLEEVLDDNDQDWLDQWSNVEERLVDAGLVTKGQRGLELTPRAVRQIGEKALEDIYSSLRKRGFGEHDLQRSGAAVNWSKHRGPGSYGDPFVLDLPRTVMNGVSRNGPGTPVRLDPSPLRGPGPRIPNLNRHHAADRYEPLNDPQRMLGRRKAFGACSGHPDPQQVPSGPARTDRLFCHRPSARDGDLPTLEWNEYAYGTNLQHALELAREKLRPERGKNRQIIVITDGEPTAHIEDGEVFFQYPPTRRTYRGDPAGSGPLHAGRHHDQYLPARKHAAYGSFHRGPHAYQSGRVIDASPRQLGNYVLRDFLRGRIAARGSWENWA